MSKPDADHCVRIDLLLDKKNFGNQDWATGPMDLRADRLLGRHGPLGLWAILGLLLVKPSLGIKKYFMKSC